MRRSFALVLDFVVATIAWPAILLGGDEADSPPLLTISANRFGSTFELMTIDVHGQNAELVLPDHCAAENPCWSPDVRKIAYRSKKSGQLQLYLYDFDRGEETNLTQTFSGEHEPTWSPDGQSLYFVRRTPIGEFGFTSPETGAYATTDPQTSQFRAAALSDPPRDRDRTAAPSIDATGLNLERLASSPGPRRPSLERCAALGSLTDLPKQPPREGTGRGAASAGAVTAAPRPSL